MGQDTIITAEKAIIAGSITGGTGANFTIDPTGNITGAGLTVNGSATVTANLTTVQQYGTGAGGVSGAAITISGTVSTTNRRSKVLPGSAVTSCVMAKGTLDGQDLVVVNLAQAAGSSVSFVAAGSAAGSSNLASNVVISGLSSAAFSWDANTAVWYAVVN